MTVGLLRPFSDPRFRRLVWLLIGILGWIGLVALGLLLAGQHPPRAGDDLNLILDAGRRVSAGQSPYIAGAVRAGTQVESLFYSYPPPVAQLASLLGGLPGATVLAVMGLLATAGFGVVVAALARPRSACVAASDLAPTTSQMLDVVLPALALAPYIYPFAIALLFGNADTWFPFAYGTVLVALTARSGHDRGWAIAGGAALGLVTVAKLQPGLLLGWLAVVGLHDWAEQRRAGSAPGSSLPTAWVVLASGIATIVLVVGASLIVGGTRPWADYVAVLRAGAGVDLATSLNIGPASQVALLAGDPGLAARVAPVLAVLAVLVTAGAAWVVRRRTLSLAIGSCASLVVSPITWFHYPVALLPFAAAAWATARGTPDARRVATLTAAAVVVAALAIALPVLLWLAVALMLASLVSAGSAE